MTLVTVILLGGTLSLLVSHLGRSRPGFAIGRPVAFAFGIRVIAATLISLTPMAQTLRGGDELTFLSHAEGVVRSVSASDEWTHTLLRELHVFVLAAQRYVFDSPELALRVTQVGIAVVGMVLLAAAVYELAGPRASVLAMWLLAFEPASIFFSSLLHKEANLMLAIGLIALGGAKIWKRGEPSSLIPIVAGCLIAVATRHYAGWFLIAASAAAVGHAGLRAENRTAIRSLSLVALVILFAAVAAPTVLSASTNESLEKNLQPSQEANASDNSNLKLEQVDFSTRGAIVVNLPRRIPDVLLRPFPWQLGNISQGIGLFGTVAAYFTFFFVIRAAFRRRGEIMTRAGPLIYLGFFLLIAYSLSAGNAGTAFRYRTQIVSVLICVFAALWRPVEHTRSAKVARSAQQRLTPQLSDPEPSVPRSLSVGREERATTVDPAAIRSGAERSVSRAKRIPRGSLLASLRSVRDAGRRIEYMRARRSGPLGTRPPVGLAVCAIFRNEARYLAEWVTFHRIQGVERFYLYNNQSTDDWRSELGPEIASGVVEVTEWPHEPGQLSAYDDCLERHRADTRWIGMFDIDEFLFSPTGAPLPEVLRRFDTHPGVVVNRRFFGTNGHRRPPDGLVTESYPMRSRDDDPSNVLVKCIVYPRMTLGAQNAHYFRFRGNPVDEDGAPALLMTREPATTELLRINHYYAKSEEEFQHKLVSPRADFGVVTDRMGIPPDEVRDEAILQFRPQLIGALASREVGHRRRSTVPE
ncbi:MAG TPA: glycosyltransferase family 92 protein [Solirubrobacterales bacterium]